MDTDELSTEAYQGILIEAENFHHDLTLEFGLLAASCEDETDYLSKAKQLIKALKRLNNSNLSDIFFDSVPTKKDLHLSLEKILTNISEVESIPENKRHFDF
jgi:hypothetical protein